MIGGNQANQMETPFMAWVVLQHIDFWSLARTWRLTSFTSAPESRGGQPWSRCRRRNIQL